MAHSSVRKRNLTTLYDEQNGAFLESFPPKITRWKFAQVHPNKEQIESKIEKPLNRCKSRTHITDAYTSLRHATLRIYSSKIIDNALPEWGWHACWLSL